MAANFKFDAATLKQAPGRSGSLREGRQKSIEVAIFIEPIIASRYFAAVEARSSQFARFISRLAATSISYYFHLPGPSILEYMPVNGCNFSRADEQPPTRHGWIRVIPYGSFSIAEENTRYLPQDVFLDWRRDMLRWLAALITSA